MKKTGKASQRRSQRLKTMLQPPGVSTQNSDAKPLQDGSLDEELVLDPARMAEILPGAAHDSTQVGVLNSCSKDADARCMARTKKGDRCLNSRLQSSKFCKKHYDEATSHKFMLQLFNSVDGPAQKAMAAWEKQQTELALRLSLEENEEVQRQIEASNRLLDARVAELGYKRVPVPPDGNCQFEAWPCSVQFN